MTAAERRAAMPQVTSWLLALQQHFPNAHVLWAVENGHKYQTRPDDYSVTADKMVLETKRKPK